MQLELTNTRTNNIDYISTNKKTHNYRNNNSNHSRTTSDKKYTQREIGVIHIISLTRGS